MERLWSPWRANYIESFKKEKENNNCIFCDTVNEDISSDNCLKVFNGETCYVVLNLYPYNSGHLLVVPNRHVADINELDDTEMTEIMNLTRLSIKALGVAIKPHGYNFGANLGKAAGAGIDSHIHFHIVPRWNGDTNFMPSIGEVKIISQDLLLTKKLIIEACKNL